MDSFETPGRTLWALLGPCPRALFSGLFSCSSRVPGPKGPGDPEWGGADRKFTVRVKIITGSLVTLENLFPEGTVTVTVLKFG